MPPIEFDLDVGLDVDEPTVAGHGRIVFDVDVGFAARYSTTGRRRRVLLVHQSGEIITELENAVVVDPAEELGSWETARITLPVDDPKLALCIPVPGGAPKFREVQIWRGNRLELWGPIVRPSFGSEDAALGCRGAAWYFSRRYVGSASIVNRLRNPGFSSDFDYWRQRMGAWFLDFEPVPFGMAGLDSILPQRVGARTLSIRTLYTDTDHPGAQQGSVSQDVEIEAGPFGSKATFSAWVYVPSADFVSYGPEKRRGLKVIRMPLDYKTNNFFTRTGGVNSWGGSRAFYTDFLDVEIAVIDEKAPLDLWMKLSASVDVPPGANEIVTAALEGIEGVTYWSKPVLTFSDGLTFSNVDQAAIVAGLVDHAQDPAFGKSDLNIETDWQPTGIRRSLFADYREHANLWTLISNYSKLASGVDLSMSYSSRRRSLRVHYPRRGLRRPELELRTDRNVASWDFVFDGENASSSEIALGAGNADSRVEGAAIETTDYADGLVLESVSAAPPDVADDDLEDYAEGILEAELDPVVLTFRTWPLSDLIDRLKLGDVVPIRLTKGAIVVTGDWRLVKRTENEDLSLSGTLNRVDS